MSLTKIFIESTLGLEFKDFFSGMVEKDGEFEKHIASSIPSYATMTKFTADSIAKKFNNIKILDIGASEGYWGDYVVQKNKSIEVHSLDPNESMADLFKRKNPDPEHPNKFLKVAFGEGFEDEGVNYEGYNPRKEYDIVRESMTFQFLSTNRKAQYRLVKEALKPRGFFITNSKNFLPDKEEYAKYEALKDEFKRRSFSDEEILKKAKEVLPSMSKYMVNLITTFESLQEYWRFVTQYWVSGNFHGFVAGNDKRNIDMFLEGLPLPNGYPDSVEGKIVDPDIIFQMKKTKVPAGEVQF